MDAAIVDDCIAEALDSLKTIDPLKVILFGSSVDYSTHQDSDLDFLVVLDDNRIPATFEQKLDLKVEVRGALTTLNGKVPIDLIVYTIPEYEEFRRINSSFCRDIHDNGKVIYEKAN